MPTLSAIQLDQCISQPYRKPPPSKMSPALFTTPEPIPIPVSPTSSFPPSSPFLINHKRRGPRLAKPFFQNELNVVVHNVNAEVMKEVCGVDDDYFFESRDSISVSSSFNATTTSTQFFDASEELSCDSGQQGAQRSLSDVEIELREIRLALLMEIEKRKQVEEGLHNMQSQWQILREKLGGAGLVLPSDLAVLEDGQSDVSHLEEICQQIHVARFVSDSVRRRIAIAEVEVEMKAQLEGKNSEIARLCDRLHYYETMNKEMSQINQETVEIARHDRRQRRRRQKWIWVSIATAITLGCAALAWSYLPGGEGSSSTKCLEASAPDSDIQ